MNSAEASRALDVAIRNVARAAHVDTSALMTLAKRSAYAVQRAANRAGDNVDIRIIQHSDGVKISVVGGNATRYKAMMSRAIEAGMSDAKADIHARIVNRSAS